MPINITTLDERLDALANAQSIRVSRAALATAILEQALERFEATDDPDAWKLPAPSSEPARVDSGRPSVIPDDQHTSASNGATDNRTAQNGAQAASTDR